MFAATRLTGLAALAAATAVVAGSCGASTGTADHATHGAAPARRTSAATSAAAALSPAELAGQRIVYSYRGLAPPTALLRRIRRAEAAGVILFADNVGTRRELRATLGELQREALASPVHKRLLIMTDQEGGQVRRLAGEPVLSERQIGESADPRRAAASAGRGAGLNLRGVGINVNLAPVLDVYRTPGNFIDEYERSYSRNAGQVAELAGAFIRAQQATGVAATAKHFPGLGAATQRQNTDEAPVTLNLPLQTLRTVDELPYQTAIGDGVRLVMLSWATYPALSPRPAGLSSSVIEGELRGRLHFHGVTITDSISAGALRDYGRTGERALLAAHAGADLILCASTAPDDASPDVGADALKAIENAILSRRLPRLQAQAAAARVLALRAGG
ncbi:MAG TPA: glycoside hydrolase family 3 N-terminal domain-containing protein [Solirubrobacteraceae bacterium]|nr:glycoside hydrolase family 3 N-terminal domain-containing protein [Solirubrobacteraceae bacterium]